MAEHLGIIPLKTTPAALRRHADIVAKHDDPDTTTALRWAADTIERLQDDLKFWNADARRLSGGLIAIREAPDEVPADVLRGIAYDIALNCITPDVAAYQIKRRAGLAE